MVRFPNRQNFSSIIPFYADPELSIDQFAALSASALHTVADIGLRHKVILVDDGLTLRGNVDIQHVVTTIRTKSHLGKAGSVRHGLAVALRQNPNAQFFIQADFDGDPDPKQITSIIKYVLQAGIKGEEPAMILGERDLALVNAGHLSTHRKALFGLQKKFCKILGFKHLTDPTTGLRVYTQALAKIFIKMGRSKGFGSDVEQLLIARVCNATVLAYKLHRARKRQDYTDISKFKDCETALLLHKHLLRKVGLGKILKIFSNLDFSKNATITIDKSRFAFVSDGQTLRMQYVNSNLAKLAA